tara:strand:- start:1638 stop:2234 length:597 start_codon:yes stop_codon:yes gene_type:complete
MTEIYEELRDDNLDFDRKFELMLGKTLEYLGDSRKPRKLKKEIVQDLCVEWAGEADPNRYIWVNFKEWMQEQMCPTFGDFVTSPSFVNDIFLKFIKNNYNIRDDKKIKLQSASLMKVDVDSKKKKCLVIDKSSDVHDRSWITSDNLVCTIKNFLRYYFECKRGDCKNYYKNYVELVENGMVRLTCYCCNSSTHINLYK